MVNSPIVTAPKQKVFNVYHVESTEDTYDQYSNGEIIANNLDEAIEELKNEWIKEEYKDDIEIEDYYTDDDNQIHNAFIKIGTDYYDKNGNELDDDEIEALEKKHDTDIGSLINDGTISYLDHYYKIEYDHEYDSEVY